VLLRCAFVDSCFLGQSPRLPARALRCNTQEPLVHMDVLLGYAVVLVVVFLCCVLVDSCFLGPSALRLVLYVVTQEPFVCPPFERNARRAQEGVFDRCTESGVLRCQYLYQMLVLVLRPYTFALTVAKSWAAASGLLTDELHVSTHSLVLHYVGHQLEVVATSLRNRDTRWCLHTPGKALICNLICV
jgi:hypothetical protein